MRFGLLWVLALASVSSTSFVMAGCAAKTADADASSASATGSSDLVGGAPDQRWAASGYLVSGPSMDQIDRSKPACGATLIASTVVVTAAHCVTDDHLEFAFGTGDTNAGALVRVASRHPHPQFHPVAEGAIDIDHALRKYDVAYLILESEVTGVEPAMLPSDDPAMGCNVQAIGYRASGDHSQRMSTPACVGLEVTLGQDPIFEVHPTDHSALCVADGDDGSPVVMTDDAGHTQLIGIYVGSVTQGLTDCVQGTQFLDGYEEAFGYRGFLTGGIVAARE